MKQVLLIVGVVSAYQLASNGIDKDDIMQNQPAHWRKQWPQGAIDNADGDSEVMNMFTLPQEKEKKKPAETYPWSLADEAVETAESLKASEAKIGSKLSAAGVKNGGLDMIFSYDNTKSVFERNTPHGNNWYDNETLKNHK